MSFRCDEDEPLKPPAAARGFRGFKWNDYAIFEIDGIYSMVIRGSAFA